MCTLSMQPDSGDRRTTLATLDNDINCVMDGMDGIMIMIRLAHELWTNKEKYMKHYRLGSLNEAEKAAEDLMKMNSNEILTDIIVY